MVCRNIIDYIVRITYRIWEDRDVEYILDTYSDSSRVFDDYGLQRGSRKIVDDTRHTTGAFSNIRLIADEIVWAGDDEVGYHTSHRTLIRGTNDGDSKYGPATGRDVDVLVIANCVALENEIFLEHVLYNNSSLLRQLGMDLGEAASRVAANPPAGWPRDTAAWNALRTAASPQRPLFLAEPVDGFDVDRFARDTLNMLWNQLDYDALGSRYVAGFAFQGPTDRAFSGAKDYARMLTALHAAFPDLELRMDKVYWMGNEHDGYLTSERWSAVGTHRGGGLYGEPTRRDGSGAASRGVLNSTTKNCVAPDSIYHEFADLKEWPDLPSCLAQFASANIYACSTKGKRHHAEAAFKHGDVLVFGPESRGLPTEYLASLPPQNILRIPMLAHSRSMNLSNAVSVMVYEAWRQMGFSGAS